MAQISNPRKQFKFSIEIIGIAMNPWLAQEVEHPDIDVEQVPHGDVNYEVKTAGRVMTGNASINKIMTTSGPDNFIFNWKSLCQDEIIGGGAIPDIYKKTVLVRELDETGLVTINTWVWEGCWPTKINGQTNSRMTSDNTIESFELSVDISQKL